MRIGVPKEIKIHEYRVGLTPNSVSELIHHGHDVIVQTRAGHEIGMDDDHYINAGAKIVADSAAVFSDADMIVKVKEPQQDECAMLRKDQTLFTFLHLAPDPDQAKRIAESGAIAIAYETVTDERGGLPLLSPMSEVAGRLSIQVGAHCLERYKGGRGVLLGGVPGTSPADVVIIGGGVAGSNAARMALGLEARVTVIDKSLPRLRELDELYGSSLNTIFATRAAIDYYTDRADLLVGSVLVPGAAAPKLVSRDQVRRMKRGAVIVDISIDQGGCIETARPTTHAEPTFIEEEVVHYCVTNMPGAVARTSTFALNNATLPFALALADKGAEQAMKDDPHLRAGLNVHHGKITHEAVAKALDAPFIPAEDALGI